MKEKKVKDLPYGVIHHIEEWFGIFETLDWIKMASLFNKMLSILQGFCRMQFEQIFLKNLSRSMQTL